MAVTIRRMSDSPAPEPPSSHRHSSTSPDRISLFDGGQYLLARLASATPTDLADAARGFANGLMDIGAATTAGAQNSDRAKRLTDADPASTKIGQLCALVSAGEQGNG